MTIVISAEICVDRLRLGRVLLNHHGLVFCADICLYKEERLWIRMPEYWTTPTNKFKIAYWESKELSDEKQHLILKKVFDILGLDLQKGLQLKRDFLTTRKELTKQENKLTLQSKNTET